jgi:hypothetical protein
MLQMCSIDKYVNGQIKQPNCIVNPKDHKAWMFNNIYAKLLITNNIEPDQIIYINQCNTSHKMWKCLEAIHKLYNWLPRKASLYAFGPG